MNKMLTIILVLCLASTASADLAVYSQDFEGMSQGDPAALGNDGWLYYATVYGPNWGWWYAYGGLPAPNGGPAFSAVAAGQGGPSQGAQQLVTYSDYNNGNQGDGSNALIETNVYREYVIGAADVGLVWTFAFDVKRGDLLSPSTAMAFIKTLNPEWGWAMTNFLQFPTHTLPTTWGTGSLSIMIDSSLVGQVLQIGFLTVASNYNPSGILYDNINFTGIRVVDIDIKPGSDPNPLRVNFRGSGVFTVAILGSDDFDASTVDVGTVTLAGVSALRGKVGDVSGGDPLGPDGKLDLVLKFDRSAVLDALEATIPGGDLGDIPNREELFLTLLGSTTGGEPITGTDSLRILNRGAIKRKK